MLSRVAVVTGSGGGIGRAVAQRLARDGLKIVVADFDEAAGIETVARINKRWPGVAKFKHTDVTDEESISNCMKFAKHEFGGIHVLVNNAVQFVFGHLMPPNSGSGLGTDRNATSEEWRRAFETNVMGYGKCIQHAVPIMLDNDISDLTYDNDQGEGVTRIHAGSRGAIVNIASVSSYIAQPEFVPYNCTKAAIVAMTKCSAMDLAPKKIRVNAVCPGSIETRGSYNHMKLIGLDLNEGRKIFGNSNLLQRQAAPEEIAAGVGFLASDDSSFMTGEAMVMDGGGTI